MANKYDEAARELRTALLKHDLISLPILVQALKESAAQAYEDAAKKSLMISSSYRTANEVLAIMNDKFLAEAKALRSAPKEKP